METSVAVTHEFLDVDFRTPLSFMVTRDAESVGSVSLFNAMGDAGVLGDISIGQADVGIKLLCLIVDSPPHDAHEGSIPKGGPPFGFQGDFAFMVQIMACLT